MADSTRQRRNEIKPHTETFQSSLITNVNTVCMITDSICVFLNLGLETLHC